MTAIRIIDSHLELADVGANDHHTELHSIASHNDTSATGAQLDTLTDNSIADTLHRHSELVASDGSPDPALSVDAMGQVGLGTNAPDGELELRKDQDGLTDLLIRNRNAHANAGSRCLLSADTSGNISIFEFALPSVSTLIPEFAGHVGFYSGSAVSGTSIVIAARSANSEIRFYTAGSAAANKRIVISKVGDLDIQGTTGALILSRMTTTQKNALTAVNGMVLYDSTLNKFQGRENGAWTNLI